MELRIWKRIYLCPFVRLSLYTRGFTISFGHRGLGGLASAGAGFEAPCRRYPRGLYLRKTDLGPTEKWRPNRQAQKAMTSLYFSFQARLSLLRNTGELLPNECGADVGRSEYLKVMGDIY
jgi:hypothetical protein